MRVLAVLVLLLVGAGPLLADEAPTANSPDNRLVATARGLTINVADAQTSKLVMSIRAHTKDVTALVYSPDGKVLFSGGKDGKVCAFDTATGRELRTFNTGKEVRRLKVSPDGRKLTVEETGNTQKNYDLATGKRSD